MMKVPGYFDRRQLSHEPVQELHNGGWTTYAEKSSRAQIIAALSQQLELSAGKLRHRLGGVIRRKEKIVLRNPQSLNVAEQVHQQRPGKFRRLPLA